MKSNSYITSDHYLHGYLHYAAQILSPINISNLSVNNYFWVARCVKSYAYILPLFSYLTNHNMLVIFFFSSRLWVGTQRTGK